MRQAMRPGVASGEAAGVAAIGQDIDALGPHPGRQERGAGDLEQQVAGTGRAVEQQDALIARRPGGAGLGGAPAYGEVSLIRAALAEAEHERGVGRLGQAVVLRWVAGPGNLGRGDAGANARGSKRRLRRSADSAERKEFGMKSIFVAAAIGLGLGAMGVTGPAEAAGCLSGAAVGGVAGHMAGHHAAIGAAAGCAIGHHEANKKQAANTSKTSAGTGAGGTGAGESGADGSASSK